jgi:ketosteroid isomerase-like protein
MRRPMFLILTAAIALAAPPALAHPGEHALAAARPAAPAPAEAARVVDAFHSALARGDTAGVLAQLADDALIFEAGGAERSKAEYASAHLAGDAAFAQAVPGKVLRRTGGLSGGFAWIASEGRTQGRYKDRDVDRATTETMLLRRDGGAWKIVHVHWSSRTAAAAH